MQQTKQSMIYSMYPVTVGHTRQSSSLCASLGWLKRHLKSKPLKSNIVDINIPKQWPPFTGALVIGRGVRNLAAPPDNIHQFVFVSECKTDRPATDYFQSSRVLHSFNKVEAQIICKISVLFIVHSQMLNNAKLGHARGIKSRKSRSVVSRTAN